EQRLCRRHLAIAEVLRAPHRHRSFLTRCAWYGDGDDLVHVLPLECTLTALPLTLKVAGPVITFLDRKSLGTQLDAEGIDIPSLWRLQPVVFGFDHGIFTERAAGRVERFIQRHAEFQADDIRPLQFLADFGRAAQRGLLAVFHRSRRGSRTGRGRFCPDACPSPSPQATSTSPKARRAT